MHGEFLLIPMFHIYVYEILKGKVFIPLIEWQLVTVDNKTFTFLNLFIVVMKNDIHSEKGLKKGVAPY